MKLHIFNPEHDIALAHGSPFFTAPKAGRGLRHDCGFLPMVWAEEDDVVLVDDVEVACRAYRELLESHAAERNMKGGDNNPVVYENKPVVCGNNSFVYDNILLGYDANLERRFVPLSDLRKLPIAAVLPWGWDMAITNQLKRAGVEESLLPSYETLMEIRKLSSRQYAAALLPEIVDTDPNVLVGEAMAASSLSDLLKVVEHHGRVMLKAPWSSSGRGLLRVDTDLNEHQTGWVKNVLEQQGAVMVEPLYNKVKDFGMEFLATGESIVYRGLSLFDTVNGAYVGNVLATEQEKLAMLAPYANEGLLQKVCKAICKSLSPHLRNKYIGPFGVDMMIVSTDEGLKLHPMVEINLRHTMGHVAISLQKRLPPIKGHMRIDYADGRYRLNLEHDNNSN